MTKRQSGRCSRNEVRFPLHANGWPPVWASIARHLQMRIPESTGASTGLSANAFFPFAARLCRLSQIFRANIFEASLSVLREAIGVVANPNRDCPIRRICEDQQIRYRKSHRRESGKCPENHWAAEQKGSASKRSETRSPRKTSAVSK